MPAKFQITDKHRAFASAVAAGEVKYKAVQKHVAPKFSKAAAQVKASLLMKQPEIKALVKQATEMRDKAIVKANVQELPKELTGAMLTVEQIDSLHYAIIRNEVEVEEIYPVTTIEKNEAGKEIRRTVTFNKLRRRANIRERQASADAIYKRFGHYAITKLFGNNGPDAEEGDQPGDRTIIFSNGEKLKF